MGGVVDQTDAMFDVYRVALHEAGHALGLSNVDLWPPSELEEQAYENAHPTIPDAVMNYDQHNSGFKIRYPGARNNTFSEPDCSPHPFDVMAVYALYK